MSFTLQMAPFQLPYVSESALFTKKLDCETGLFAECTGLG